MATLLIFKGRVGGGGVVQTFWGFLGDGIPPNWKEVQDLPPEKFEKLDLPQTRLTL